jgi:Skp family chaperone for outer membrane proteins
MLSVFVLSLLVCSQAFAAADKIGYVDLAKIFDDYEKTKTFDKSLETKGTAKQAERDKMAADIRAFRSCRNSCSCMMLGKKLSG